MKLTYKAIARAADYHVYDNNRSVKMYSWRSGGSPVQETSDWGFETPEEAYKDCCIQCGLVEIE